MNSIQQWSVLNDRNKCKSKATKSGFVGIQRKNDNFIGCTREHFVSRFNDWNGVAYHFGTCNRELFFIQNWSAGLLPDSYIAIFFKWRIIAENDSCHFNTDWKFHPLLTWLSFAVIYIKSKENIRLNTKIKLNFVFLAWAHENTFNRFKCIWSKWVISNDQLFFE